MPEEQGIVGGNVPNERPKHELECVKCHAKWMADFPQTMIRNEITYSMVLLVHENFAVCPGCGQIYGFFISPEKFNVMIGAAPLEKKAQAPANGQNDRSRILLPPDHVMSRFRKQ